MGKPPPEQSEAGLAEERAHHSAERRSFLKQAALVTGAAVGASGLATLLRDPTGERGKPKRGALVLPANGFMVEPSSVLPVLGVATGIDAVRLVRGAIDQIGGISRFISNGDIVVIKPNVAFERAASLGATSNPEVLKALIHLVREAGAKEVRVADNPIESPESCFVRSGIQKAVVEVGARVYLPTLGDFRTLYTKNAT